MREQAKSFVSQERQATGSGVLMAIGFGRTPSVGPDEVIVDGTGWSASRSTLDPNDQDAADGFQLDETELDGWVARFE